MVSEPLQYLDQLSAVGAKGVIIHYDSTADYMACATHALQHGYVLGLAVLPTVDIAVVQKLIHHFSYIQVMGIREVGAQGQVFAEESLSLIQSLRQMCPEMEIAVDGSVNESTIPRLIHAGANRLAPGSAVIAASDQAYAYRALQQLATSQQADMK
jgi:ribulose-phosphate 3-epimerase